MKVKRADDTIYAFTGKKGLLLLSQWILDAQLCIKEKQKDSPAAVDFLVQVVNYLPSLISLDVFDKNSYQENKIFFDTFKDLRTFDCPEVPPNLKEKVGETYEALKTLVKRAVKQSKETTSGVPAGTSSVKKEIVNSDAISAGTVKPSAPLPVTKDNKRKVPDSPSGIEGPSKKVKLSNITTKKTNQDLLAEMMETSLQDAALEPPPAVPTLNEADIMDLPAIPRYDSGSGDATDLAQSGKKDNGRFAKIAKKKKSVRWAAKLEHVKEFTKGEGEGVFNADLYHSVPGEGENGDGVDEEVINDEDQKKYNMVEMNKRKQLDGDAKLMSRKTRLADTTSTFAVPEKHRWRRPRPLLNVSFPSTVNTPESDAEYHRMRCSLAANYYAESNIPSTPRFIGIRPPSIPAPLYRIALPLPAPTPPPVALDFGKLSFISSLMKDGGAFRKL